MNGPKDGLNCYEITKLIYVDTPSHLIPPASRNTMLVVLKLEKDGVLRRGKEDTSKDPMTGIQWVISKAKY